MHDTIRAHFSQRLICIHHCFLRYEGRVQIQRKVQDKTKMELYIFLHMIRWYLFYKMQYLIRGTSHANKITNRAFDSFEECFPAKISQFISTMSQKLIEISNIHERLMKIHLEKHYQIVPKKDIITVKNGITSPYVKK